MTFTIILLCGAGIGALISTLFFLLALKAGNQRRSEEVKAYLEYWKNNSDLLTERNDIGRRQVNSLETIADWCKANWKP